MTDLAKKAIKAEKSKRAPTEEQIKQIFNSVDDYNRVINVVASAVSMGKVTPGGLQAIRKAKETFDKLNNNDYHDARIFWETDPDVYGRTVALSLFIRYSYRGLKFNDFAADKDKYEENKINNTILAIMDQVDSLSLKQKAQSAGIYLQLYGDAVFWKKNGLMLLPMEHLTAIPKAIVDRPSSREELIVDSGFTDSFSLEDDKGVITSIDYYVIDEGLDTQFIIPKEDVIHISLHRDGQFVRDNRGRLTFGIWSGSPMSRAVGALRQKLSVVINDIAWRDKMVPREHHKLDFTNIDFYSMEGDTAQERYSNAQSFIQDKINNYIKTLGSVEVDMGYITANTTEIDVLEPKTRSYADTTPVLDQFNQAMASVSGLPNAAIYGETQGSTYASELLTSNYAAMRTNVSAEEVWTPLINYAKEQLNTDIYPQKIIKRLRPKLMLLMPKDVIEIAKAFTMLMAANVLSFQTIEELTGIDMPASQAELKENLKLYKDILETVPKSGQFGDNASETSAKGLRSERSTSNQPKTGPSQGKDMQND
jgi:hypothetical protein